MNESRFSKWEIWGDRGNIPGINFPGIYVLAISEVSLSGKPFSWIKEIEYVGMTNSKGGLKGRLQQFENTMRGKSGHGGARRFRFVYPDASNIEYTLFNKFYVSVAAFDCDVTLPYKPEDLIVMGDVAKAEYECFARYLKEFKEMPKYNNKEDNEKLPK